MEEINIKLKKTKDETKKVIKKTLKDIEKSKIEAENKDINKTNIKQNKKFTIMGLTIWRILAYFIIYSVVGYFIETIFSSITEYLVSLFGELILGVKWWDYSNMPLNINGRICVYFSLFWGFLALYLIASFNPRIDRLINWIKKKISLWILKTLTLSVTIILFVDCVITSFAMSFFLIRMVAQNDLNVPNKEIVVQKYEEIYNNEKLADFIYKYWDDKKMIRTFPNVKIEDVDGNIIYIDSLLSDIQTYYFKFHEPRDINFKLNING